MKREEMRPALFEYIEVDYKRTRRHSAHGYLSPVNFEKNMSLNAVSNLTVADQYVDKYG